MLQKLLLSAHLFVFKLPWQGAVAVSHRAVRGPGCPLVPTLPRNPPFRSSLQVSCAREHGPRCRPRLPPAAAAARAAHPGPALRLHAGGEGRLLQSPQERPGGLQPVLQVRGRGSRGREGAPRAGTPSPSPVRSWGFTLLSFRGALWGFLH